MNYIAGMYRIPAILFFLLFTACAYAQPSITGRVVRADNGEAIQGSSVFITNTSRGTVSGADGSFELHQVPAGKYELVISSVGFETTVYAFTSEQLPLRLRIEMQVKVRELPNVTVEPSVEEGWDKWGLTFTENFMGATPNAANCEIRNRQKIKFRYFRKSNRIIAYCDEPLEIVNRALGYRIKYQLEEFELKFDEKWSRYMGYVLFEDMDGSRKNVRKRWQRARDEAFYGSMMHFWRAVYANKVKEDGFEMRRMWRTPNLEKQRIRGLYRSRSLVRSGNVQIGVTPGGKGDTLSVDSTHYYETILRQPDEFEHYGKTLLTVDSILFGTSSSYKEIYFTDFLHVTYKNEKEDPGYLRYFRENRSPAFQRSSIWIIDPTAIAIFRDGSYDPPTNVFTTAYWAWSDKIGDMLPLDYEPYGPAPKLK